MSEPERLLYRSNLLGSDKRITNYGGGNTSVKVWQKDPLTGEKVEVLWVKGSGGDVGTIKLDGFATLYMDKLRALKRLYRGVEHEDEMVGYLPHCTFNLNPRAASIDTPLHAFVPHAHVDHMHPDAIIAIAAAQELQGADAGDLRRRDRLAAVEAAGLRARPVAREILPATTRDAKGVVLESHGLFTWGDTPKDCYETTIAHHQPGHRLVRERDRGQAGLRRRSGRKPLPAAERRAIAARLMPQIRGLISARRAARSGISTTSPPCWNSSARSDLRALAALGTSCPDHFLRTKIRPLVIDFDPGQPDLDAVVAGLRR